MSVGDAAPIPHSSTCWVRGGTGMVLHFAPSQRSTRWAPFTSGDPTAQASLGEIANTD